nr:MAG TPA: hypothetical protein [Caudoviricetes sp.]
MSPFLNIKIGNPTAYYYICTIVISPITEPLAKGYPLASGSTRLTKKKIRRPKSPYCY